MNISRARGSHASTVEVTEVVNRDLQFYLGL